MKKVIIIHGPNLNMLGKRDIIHYGEKDLDYINNKIKEKAKRLGIFVEMFQSNFEGEIIQKIHEVYSVYDGLIINPGAFTHYSYAIRDAIELLNKPVIEVHISNIYKRENFRRKSVISSVCNGQITGLGFNGYLLALEAMTNLL